MGPGALARPGNAPGASLRRARAGHIGLGKSRALLPVCALLLATMMPISAAHAAALNVAVAANFVAVLQSLVPQFESQTGHQVLVSGASTGTLYAQIRNGAPFDVFLAADMQRPRQLIAQGLADRRFAFVYAQGVLVLFAPGRVLPATLEQALRAPYLRYLAVANPKTAPYGAAAAQVLTALENGPGGPLLVQRVIGSSIGQTFQYVMTGNAEMGFVALSQVLAVDRPVGAAHVRRVDRQTYAPLQQGGVVLKRSKHPAAAVAFSAFLTSAETQALIEAAGYMRPAGGSW